MQRYIIFVLDVYAQPPLLAWTMSHRTKYSPPAGSSSILHSRWTQLSSYELNRQRNNRINGCNCRGIAVMFVQCKFRTDDKVK